MLEWLKDILGDGYNEEIDKALSKKIGEEFVSRVDFNEKNASVKKLEEAIADRDKQLKELGESNGSIEEFQKQIADLQAQNKEAADKYAADILKVKTDNAVEKALSAAGARNNIAVKALLSEFLTNAKLGEDGAVEGLADEIQKLSTDEGTAFLFSASSGNQQFSGLKPGDPGGRSPGASMDAPKTYQETVKWMEENPGKPLPK